VARGGLGEHLALHLQKSGILLNHFIHRYAVGYPDQLYGSQNFHNRKSNLDADSLIQTFKEFFI